MLIVESGADDRLAKNLHSRFSLLLCPVRIGRRFRLRGRRTTQEDDDTEYKEGEKEMGEMRKGGVGTGLFNKRANHHQHCCTVQ